MFINISEVIQIIDNRLLNMHKYAEETSEGYMKYTELTDLRQKILDLEKLHLNVA
jgi:hypothetical protein